MGLHPTVTRVFHYGDSRLVATPIPSDAWMVRRHPNGGSHYDRMTVVNDLDEGSVLHLAGWIGSPRDIPWLGARDAMFPKAREVQFERLTGTGLVEHRLLLR